ncbi:MAG: hypothetical protein ABWX67_01000 [Allosphingosinicella sp.]
MFVRPFLGLALAAMAALGGCAAAPRAPATTLADAGLKATGSFSDEVRNVATQLREADAADSFTRTWELCQSPVPGVCAPSVTPERLSMQRNGLADVVDLRARAIDQLGAAYAAFKQEASYDQSTDLQGATKSAIDSANSFGQAAAVLNKGKRFIPAVPGEVGALLDFGFGVLGDRLQRKRLLRANREIAQAVLQLRNGMQNELEVFLTLTDYLVGKRTAARLVFYDAKLTSPMTVMTPLADQLDVTLVPGAESMIANSPALRTALRATMEANSRVEVLEAQGRYRAGIAGLDALLRQHRELETKQSVTVGDVERIIDQLNASLAKYATQPQGDQGNAQQQEQQQQQQQ